MKIFQKQFKISKIKKDKYYMGGKLFKKIKDNLLCPQ